MRTFGGELELDIELLGTLGERSVSWPFQSCQSVVTGRTGLKLILEMISKDCTLRALLPAYLCPSVLQPFKERNVTVQFYRVRQDLKIDVADLVYQFEIFRPNVLLFINYFGFPVESGERQALFELREQCWIIEDCVHGSLVESETPVVGQLGHFVITSFRKYLPVPDGGLVINHTDFRLPNLLPARGCFVERRLLGKFLRHAFLTNNQMSAEFETVYLELFKTAEKEVDARIPFQAMSRISEKLLGVMDLSYGMVCRRKNYDFLLGVFQKDTRLLPICTPVFSELPEAVSPLVFPVRTNVEKRDVLLKKLIARGVFCPVHWHLPAEIQADSFTNACQLSREIVSLPIDQRYDEGDMEELITRLVEIGERTP